MKTKVKNHQAGFTLIEFIVALVLVAFIAAMVYTYFGNALTQSSVPIARLKQALNLQKVMENINTDYNRLNKLNLRYHWQPSTYYGLDAVVTPKTIPASPNGGHYYVNKKAGTSSTTEPTWQTSGTLPADGGVIWKESGNIVWQKSHPYIVGDIVVPINNTGHYYKCTTGGTSDATAPATTAWLPTTVPDTPWTITDGPVRWTEAGTILDSSDNALQDNITYILNHDSGNKYGTGYSVVAAETKFVQFDSTNTMKYPPGTDSTSYEKNILKVTIKNSDSAETLTHYFTIR